MILNIQPLNIESLTYDQNREIEQRLNRILHEWEGTPYCPGQQCKGVAVDCVRFVAGVLDEMLCMKNKLERLPQDASFHNPTLVKRGLRKFLTHYPCAKLEDTTQAQPGDVVIMGPKNGGPGHAAIIGLNGYWHCSQYGVNMAGLATNNQGVYVFKEVRRGTDRETWYDRMFGGDNGK